MRRSLIVAGLGLGVLAAAAAWSLLRPGPAREIRVEVREGAGASRVLADLHRRGLVPLPLTGRLYLALAARGRLFHYGRYRIPPRSRPVDVIGQLLEGRVLMVSVTVVEGSTLADIGARMAAAGIGSPNGWLRVAGHVDWIADLAPEAPSLEGFLFPDTYRFAEGTRAASAARTMVERFRQVWREEVARAPAPWGSPLKVVTLASMVEAETAVAAERPLIAGVFVNRLRRGMLLQCDPTVVYTLRRRGPWQGPLLRVDLGIDDPYNTYRYAGLPPGPINSPGREALRAALAPASTRYLYFVATREGRHRFSTTLRAHNRAVAELRRSRR